MPSHTFWVIHPMEGNAVDLRNHCCNALMQHCFFLMVLSHQVKLGFKIGGRLHSLIFFFKKLVNISRPGQLCFSVHENIKLLCFYLLGVLF